MRSTVVTIALIATASPLLAQRNDCQPATTPKQLPSAGALVDSARLMEALAAFEAPEGMLFSLVYLEEDSLPLVRPLFETDLAAARILAGLLRAQPRSRTWAVRVRVAQGPAPSLWIERALYCPPGWIEQGDSRRTIRTQVMPGDRIPTMGRRRSTFEVEVLVSADGLPVRVHMSQSSGMRGVDEEIVADWRRARFDPALLDGFPIEAVYRSGGKSPRL